MIEAQRITFHWGPRPESAAELGKRLHDALNWGAQVGALKGSWTTTQGKPPEVKRPEIVPCTSPAALEAAIAEGSFRAKPDAPVTTIEASAFLGTFRKHKASLRLLSFPEERDKPHLDRAILCLYEPLDAEQLRKLFIGWIAVFRPAYGFVALHRRPLDGAPLRAGWLTFFDPSFAAPSSLPSEAVVSSLGGLGTVIQASPRLMDLRLPADRKALADLQAALHG